ncbi:MULTISPECIES: tartrate-resistant acid phosphatase type 5 family protein [unclassified Arcicella]|uniref:purple acid phosphatase family protein n=1 Tax=unclassified Arcicella TaxID=2644986 RepID=UPI002866C90B|nr:MULTISPECIES: tartrate-resistant acid phosphatase type 5 family protein [unclassified Arcicella]MDR6560100.1 3',5'-cyclic AMP phosphodiesterase CpdA [Arcicella sp. BE51]MDR6810293.1 3',5'-cyclic AMP phosphodiesterase CpdA [Arcicella sp. BE140]MDR6821643.1 3',5'-cyclic AMP phosphodiesterase CpdA [Arcicella sp. BE139]
MKSINVFKSFCLVCSLFTSGIAVGQTTELNSHAGALNFLVMGDWGRNGADHQKPVASQMGKVATKIKADFIIATGDNFYPSGVRSEYDPLWKYSFEDIYTDFSLQWDWFPVLGNHDYKSNPDAQVAYSKISRRWNMPARYYSKTFSINGDANQQVLIAFIDTNPLIPEFYKGEYSNAVVSQDSTAQKVWLDKTLSNNSPSIKWKIVVGHHPLFTATEKRRESYDTRAIRASLKSVLDKHKVDAYLCGHDHDLQHLLPEGKTHYFVSGSASEKTPIGTLPISKLALSDYGFMVFSATGNKLFVQVINEEGKVVYTTELTK